VQHIGQIFDLFLDDSIADSVSFGEIKRRSFSILERAKAVMDARAAPIGIFPPAGPFCRALRALKGSMFITTPRSRSTP
jgi:hypothetical protein